MPKILFPIKKAYPSKEYGLIIEDSADIIHYWNHDYSYDGYSSDPCIDITTRTNKN